MEVIQVTSICFVQLWDGFTSSSVSSEVELNGLDRISKAHTCLNTCPVMHIRAKNEIHEVKKNRLMHSDTNLDKAWKKSRPGRLDESCSVG